MSRLRSALAAAILAGVASLLVLPVLLARTPASVASLALGTDEAFSTGGLEPRERLVGGAILRWTRRTASFRFEEVGPGPVTIEFFARDHLTDLTLLVNGAIVGSLAPGERRFATTLSLSGPSLDFGMETDGFPDSQRTLGTQVIALTVAPVRPDGSLLDRVPKRLGLALAAVVLVASLCQAYAGPGVLPVLIPPTLLLLMVLPAGLWRSPWLIECASKVVAATVLAAGVARLSKGGPAARAGLHSALLLALVVHGVVPASPLLAQSDALFHSHKLGVVARGNMFPTSLTDHRPPFEIPYGFGFYGSLTPWASSEAVNLEVVREASAVFSALSALALALCTGRASASLAALTVLLWTFTPANIQTMAFGNLSNVFSQAVFVLFLAGATIPGRGWVRLCGLTLLAALAATSHLSSFIVLLTLFAAARFVPQDRQSQAFQPLLGGVALGAGYYACFLPMILVQLPRLLTERGGRGGVFDLWRLPNQLLLGVGWPLILLVVLALLARRATVVLPLTRSLALTGFLLAILALVSPVEVRYLLALAPLIAIFGASTLSRDVVPSSHQGVLRTGDDPVPSGFLGGPAGRALATALVCLATLHGARVLLEFMPLSGV